MDFLREKAELLKVWLECDIYGESKMNEGRIWNVAAPAALLPPYYRSLWFPYAFSGQINDIMCPKLW